MAKIKLNEEDIKEILQFYIKLTKKTRVSKVPDQVTARMKAGCSVQDAKYIILYKFLEWWDNPRMRHAVNLMTLFRPSHFEEYLCQAEDGLDELLKRQFKLHLREWFEENYGKPLKERQKLKAPIFEEYKKEKLGEMLSG